MNSSASTVSFPRRRMSSSDALMSSVFHVLKSVELSRTASAHTSEVLQLVRRSAASIKHSRPWPKHAKIVGRGCVSSSKTCERSVLWCYASSKMVLVARRPPSFWLLRANGAVVALPADP